MLDADDIEARVIEMLEAKKADKREALRDHFAGLAMQGLMSACDRDGTWTGEPERAARIAYKTADAMLEARGETPKG